MKSFMKLFVSLENLKNVSQLYLGHISAVIITSRSSLVLFINVSHSAFTKEVSVTPILQR